MEMSFHVSVSPGAVKRNPPLQKKTQRETHKVLVMTAGASSDGAERMPAIRAPSHLRELTFHVHQRNSAELLPRPGLLGRDLPV